jgi:hypothetical protein
MRPRLPGTETPTRPQGRDTVGGMTLAVPGATGFVALAQRAVIGRSGSFLSTIQSPVNGTRCEHLASGAVLRDDRGPREMRHRTLHATCDCVQYRPVQRCMRSGEEGSACLGSVNPYRTLSAG